MIMYDILGYPLQVGDPVFYTTGGQSDTGLYKGTIVEITLNTGKVPKSKALLKNGMGRTMTNFRMSTELLSAKYLIPLASIQQTEPELFL